MTASNVRRLDVVESLDHIGPLLGGLLVIDSEVWARVRDAHESNEFKKRHRNPHAVPKGAFARCRGDSVPST